MLNSKLTMGVLVAGAALGITACGGGGGGGNGPIVAPENLLTPSTWQIATVNIENDCGDAPGYMDSYSLEFSQGSKGELTATLASNSVDVDSVTGDTVVISGSISEDGGTTAFGSITLALTDTDNDGYLDEVTDTEVSWDWSETGFNCDGTSSLTGSMTTVPSGPITVSGCDVDFEAGINSDSTAYFELSRRDLYVENSECLFGDDEIHVAESVLDIVGDQMASTRGNFNSTSDAEIGGCEYDISGQFFFSEQEAVITDETSLDADDSECGYDLFTYSALFKQVLIYRIYDAVVSGSAGFADGDVGRITFEYPGGDISSTD